MADGDRAHPRAPALTVDGVVIARPADPRAAGPPQVLLIQRGAEPFAGRWALPGGFVEYGEDPDLAVAREVAEETGLEGLPFRQFRVFGAPDRDPRGHTVTVVYAAEIAGEPPHVAGADDAAAARWFGVDGLPPLAFDHRGILNSYLEDC